MAVVETFPTADAWAEACAARLTDALAAGLAADGRAVFLGSGGSTPAPIYARMKTTDIDWSRVLIGLIDERYVPESSPESNARLLKETLLIDRAASATFVPMFHAEVTVDRAAAVAAHALAGAVDAASGRLAAVLLGMGDNGHICSMFPGSPTLKTLLTPGLAPTVLGVPRGRDGLAPSLERLSINLPWLMRADRVVLALSGAVKRSVFEQEAAGDPAVHPIAALIAAGVALEILWTETADG